MPSRHGRPDRILVARTANAKTCPGCRLTFGRCRGGRRGSSPIYRLEPGTYFHWSPDLFLPPQSPAGSPRPKENPKNYSADHILAQWRLGMGMGYRELSLEGVEIYDHPAHSRNMD